MLIILFQKHQITRICQISRRLVFALICSAAPLTAQNQKSDIYEFELGYTQIEIQFYGIYSRTLEEYHQKALHALTVDLLENDREFKLHDWTSTLDSIYHQYAQTEKISEKSLFSFLPAGKYKNGIYITFEKVDEHFFCDVYFIATHKKSAVKIKSLHLYSSIQKSIRKAALHIHGVLRQHFNLEEKPDDPLVLMKLKSPLFNATQLYNDLIIAQDTLSELYHGSVLITSPRAGNQIINGTQFKFILFPNSSYTFMNHSILKLNRGKIGLILLGQSTQIITPSVVVSATNCMITISHESKSQVHVFAGKMIVNPVFEPAALDTVPYPYTVSSLGYHFNKARISDSVLTREFKLFIPYLNGDIINHFKVGNNSLFQEPAYQINYFAQEISSPIDYFIAQGFSNMGTPFEALQFEGEAWQSSSRTLTPDINETSCFLCKPNGVSDPNP